MALLSLVFPFFGLIFLGFLAGKRNRSTSSLGWLHTFVFYFALPALFFQLVSRTPFEELANWRFIASTTFATYCAFVVAFVIGIISTRGNIAHSTIQGAIGSYSNVGYLGPGLTLAALGPAAAVPTALIFTFDNILLFTIVPLLMALGNTTDQGEKKIVMILVGVVKKVLFHPFIIATILGVIAAYFKFVPPDPIERLLGMLGQAAAPCALFALGISMAQRPMKRVPSELPFLIAAKLMIHPGLMVVILTLAGGFSPEWFYTAILMAALPTAANVFVMAEEYKSYVERTSATIFIATVASVVTVSAVLYLVTNNLIPVN
ncbi:MAG: AEC family transporter [Rhizobiales bacterium]|nr:AEC family transporter [Hyphomicrobiales bacterium]